MNFEAQPWPPGDLERVVQCPLCGSGARASWLQSLTDRIFRVAPGRWQLWRCGSCDCAYLDPRPTAASIGRAYESYYTHEAAPERHFIVPGDRPDLWFKRALHASFYARRFGHHLSPSIPGGWLLIESSARRRARAGQYIRHLPAPKGPGEVCLDLGCGSGSFLRVARALGYEAQGVELDPAAAAAATSAGFTVDVQPIEAVDRAPESVAQVTLNHVIEHLHDPLAALRRIHSWLRPGGRVWLQTPNIGGQGAAKFGESWRGLEPPRHLVLFTPEGLGAALQRTGFERISLLPPQLDAEFYISQSRAIEADQDPYLRQDRSSRRRSRKLGRAWDRLALASPAAAESITLEAFKPLN